ncbi:sex comb on midleg-like protein 4 isoform X4 [Phascolarctos cinereus]|uniref:Sex comb on midleg-like protein 4 isoform X3 n=1 Tax=Phascolarctos cinereus TaxID=38626 RepID=A0A6P5LZ07_PHACI|nr:sex comb on midleg-like protein 4 isoform X3 [Phascolarctos cinereus]
MAEMQSPRIAGRKRGRPPLHSAPMKMAVHNLYSSSACSLPVVKIPKKRGRKPGHKLKSRVLMTPLAISPPRSTPEPDVSSIPQDAATIPSSAAAAQGLTAKTVISEDYLADPVGMKRYSMDPSNSAFNCTGSSSSSSLYSGRLSSGEGCLGRGLTTSSCSHRSGPVSSSGPSTVGLRHQASSFLRNGTYSEGNKSASSPSPDGQDAARPTSKNPSTWTVEDVVWFVKDADPQALGPHVELFRKHEIDGNALLLLKSDMVMKYLGLKLGPALKLCYHIDKLKQSKF